MAVVWKYLRYLLRHRWYVFRECARYGILWRGLVHDLSKLRPDEFFAYAEYFYGPQSKPQRDATGYYKPTDTADDAFDFAWLLHQKRNRHHWQWWVLPEDDGGIKVLQMAYPYDMEMLCDWIGAGKAQGRFSPPEDPLRECRVWYKANKQKMRLHPFTKAYIEDILDDAYAGAAT